MSRLGLYRRRKENMTNICQNCGEPTEYKHCTVCAEWLTLLDIKKREVQIAEASNRPRKTIYSAIYFVQKAIVSLEFSLALRKKNAELLRNGLRFVAKA